jgi:hypothetical protein
MYEVLDKMYIRILQMLTYLQWSWFSIVSYFGHGFDLEEVNRDVALRAL